MKDNVIERAKKLESIKTAFADLIKEVESTNSAKWYGTDIDLYDAECALLALSELLTLVPEDKEEWQYEKKFIYKQVERGLFDKHTKPEMALKNIAYWPDAPWASDKWNWDVSHKEYADEFYKAFPTLTKQESKPNKE